jgi:hypothetical protein
MPLRKFKDTFMNRAGVFESIKVILGHYSTTRPLEII